MCSVHKDEQAMLFIVDDIAGGSVCFDYMSVFLCTHTHTQAFQARLPETGCNRHVAVFSAYSSTLYIHIRRVRARVYIYNVFVCVRASACVASNVYMLFVCLNAEIWKIET